MYSVRVDPRQIPPLVRVWTAAIDAELRPGSSFDLDFHTIPSHGDEALTEGRSISKRSRQKGVLSLVVRDADPHVVCYVERTVRKQDRHEAPLRFAENFRERPATYPDELVSDSGLTIQPVLDRLGIGFLTVQRRGTKILQDLRTRPDCQWKRVTLSDIGRRYRTPHVPDELVTLAGYPRKVRHLAVADLGHPDPELLITNRFDESAAGLIDR